MKQAFEGFTRPKPDGGKTPYLNGDASIDDVASGKTFYNTDANNKQTGTGNNAKRKATGTATADAQGRISVNGLTFTPSKVELGVVTNGSIDIIEDLFTNVQMLSNSVTTNFCGVRGTTQRGSLSELGSILKPTTFVGIVSNGFKSENYAAGSSVPWKAWE